MSKVIKEIQFGEHTLVLETGEIARQADGAVFASMGGTGPECSSILKRVALWHIRLQIRGTRSTATSSVLYGLNCVSLC